MSKKRFDSVDEMIEFFREQGRKGGKIGGVRAAETMTPEQRKERARKAAAASAKVRSKKAAAKKRAAKKVAKGGK